MAKSKSDDVNINRRAMDDRRGNNSGDRRKQTPQTVAVERRDNERRKTPRRRQIDPTTCERDYSNDEIEFMHALDAYKRTSGRMFPTCSEILEVIRHLGYVRVTSANGEAPAVEATPITLVLPTSTLPDFGSPANV